jgi:hypothetical protein
MARISTASLLFFLVVFSAFAACLEGRKLLDIAKESKKRSVASLGDSLILSALPKGKVPSSTPSKKGHGMVVDEKLVARHLISISDRSLRSVPSPGVGH